MAVGERVIVLFWMLRAVGVEAGVIPHKSCDLNVTVDLGGEARFPLNATGKLVEVHCSDAENWKFFFSWTQGGKVLVRDPQYEGRVDIRDQQLTIVGNREAVNLECSIKTTERNFTSKCVLRIVISQTTTDGGAGARSFTAADGGTAAESFVGGGSNITGIAVGVTVPVVVLLAIIIAVILMKRRKHRENAADHTFNEGLLDEGGPNSSGANSAQNQAPHPPGAANSSGTGFGESERNIEVTGDVVARRKEPYNNKKSLVFARKKVKSGHRLTMRVTKLRDDRSKTLGKDRNALQGLDIGFCYDDPVNILKKIPEPEKPKDGESSFQHKVEYGKYMGNYTKLELEKKLEEICERYLEKDDEIIIILQEDRSIKWKVGNDDPWQHHTSSAEFSRAPNSEFWFFVNLAGQVQEVALV